MMDKQEKQQHKEKTINNEDYRFLTYRLDQLEINLLKGQEKLEFEYKEQNKQIMQTLQVMQQGQNQQLKNITEVTQRLYAIEEKSKGIDPLKEATTSHAERIKELERRLDIYKVITIGIITTLVGAGLLEIVRMIH